MPTTCRDEVLRFVYDRFNPYQVNPEYRFLAIALPSTPAAKRRPSSVFSTKTLGAAVAAHAEHFALIEELEGTLDDCLRFVIDLDAPADRCCFPLERRLMRSRHALPFAAFAEVFEADGFESLAAARGAMLWFHSVDERLSGPPDQAAAPLPEEGSAESAREHEPDGGTGTLARIWVPTYFDPESEADPIAGVESLAEHFCARASILRTLREHGWEIAPSDWDKRPVTFYFTAERRFRSTGELNEALDELKANGVSGLTLDWDADTIDYEVWDI